MRRTLSFALIAGVIALMPLAVMADTITETVSLGPIPATSIHFDSLDSFSTVPFPEFNPALGTLNQVSATLTGPASWTGASGSMELHLLWPDGNFTGNSASQSNGTGNFNVDLAETSTFSGDLGSLTGTGDTDLTLALYTFVTGTFASPSGLSGSITYTYTPVAAPEASSFVLLGVVFAVFALIGFARRRTTAAASAHVGPLSA